MSNKGFHKDYLIQQIITIQQKTPNSQVMSPVFLRDFSTGQLEQFLKTCQTGYINKKIYQYFEYFIIFLFGLIVGRLI